MVSLVKHGVATTHGLSVDLVLDLACPLVSRRRWLEGFVYRGFRSFLVVCFCWAFAWHPPALPGFLQGMLRPSPRFCPASSGSLLILTWFGVWGAARVEPGITSVKTMKQRSQLRVLPGQHLALRGGGHASRRRTLLSRARVVAR